MAAAPVGLIANPASGKDIRRLVAHASVFDNEEKRNIVRRVILGAAAAGADRFLLRGQLLRGHHRPRPAGP